MGIKRERERKSEREREECKRCTALGCAGRRLNLVARKVVSVKLHRSLGSLVSLEKYKLSKQEREHDRQQGRDQAEQIYTLIDTPDIDTPIYIYTEARK